MATRKRKGTRKPARRKPAPKRRVDVRPLKARLKKLLEERKKLELNIIELETRILTFTAAGCPWKQ